MEMHESPVAALSALQASLQSEREWRNIQTSIFTAVGRLVAIASAQQQRLDELIDRISGFETARDQQNEVIQELRSHIAGELKDAMQENHAKLTERVCAHVDARLVAQRDELEHAWTKRKAEINFKRRDELDAMRKQLTEEIEQIAIARDVACDDDAKLDALDRKVKRLEKQLKTTESEFTAQWTGWRDDLARVLESKASQRDLTSVIDAQSVQLEELRDKLHDSTTENTTQLELERQAKVDEQLTQLKAHMHELVGIVETLQGEQTVLKTLTIDHFQNGATDTTGDHTHDTRRAVLKLHDAVKSVRRSVETVAKRAELEAVSEQVAWLRKQLRSEIYQARYIWKEGRPTTKQTIAWTTQVVNTNSDVFVWQRSTSEAVTTMVPGLYHLQAAFFTSLEPVLQVMVNGEPALIATSPAIHDRSTENQDHETFNKIHCGQMHRRRLHHSAGDIVGLEISAFLALPPRTVITISYDIDERAQGFLNLRKL